MGTGKKRKSSNVKKPKTVKETAEKLDKLDLFNVIHNLYTKQSPPLTNAENFKETYMLQRFLSMRPEGFWAAQGANTFSNKIPPWAVERLLYRLIGQIRRPPFGKYIKPPTGEKTFTRAILERLAGVLHCKLHHAEQTAALLTKQGVDVYALFGEKVPTKGKE